MSELPEEIKNESQTAEPTKKSKKKHKRNKKSAANSATQEIENEDAKIEEINCENQSVSSANIDSIMQKLKGMQDLNLEELIKPQKQEALQKKTFKFWNTQVILQKSLFDIKLT